MNPRKAVVYGSGMPHQGIGIEYHPEDGTVSVSILDRYGDRVFSRVDEAELLARLNDIAIESCDYTFAHTRHWCGNRGCRDS